MPVFFWSFFEAVSSAMCLKVFLLWSASVVGAGDIQWGVEGRNLLKKMFENLEIITD